ncbi:Hsp20/alpha crystallin family protein [Candidatus Sumerlaeota bacterium]|nr:Hsp20/alpha crystallin family protein [Candidatus Sumerlaeota bacterium]
MALKDTLKTHVPMTWTLASLAVALIAVGVIAAIDLQEVRAKEEGAVVADVAQDKTLRQIETILQDEEKEADARIEEALKALKAARLAAADKPTPSTQDPLADVWSPLAWSLTQEGWDPFREMNRMRHGMDRVFNDAFARMNAGAPGLQPDAVATWSPQGEFEKTKDAYVYRFDLPGIEKGEVSVTVEDGRLIVEGKRESRVEESNEDKGIERREIRYGAFRRATALPNDVDAQGAIESKLENGVLTVTLPKTKNAQKPESRKIEIR